MTEKLRTLMEDTAAVEFAVPDLDAIAAVGDRTVRRRRAGLAVAGVALLGAASVGGAALWQVADPGEERTQVASPPDADELSWAMAGVLRTEGGPIDLGHPVAAYVRTSVGFVVADEDGRVTSVVDGVETEVGAMERSSISLVGDDEQPVAGWVERSGGRATFVAYDQETGEYDRFPARSEDPEHTSVLALDAGWFVVDDGGEDTVLDLAGGPRAAVGYDPGRRSQLLALEDGVFAWTVGDDAGDDYVLGRTEDEKVVIDDVHGYRAAFSPDARWVSFDADEPRVHDVATGEQVEIDIDGRIFASGYEWLDDDTLAMIASRGEVGPAELIVCEIPAGTCDVVEPDLGSFEELVTGGFALPVGTPIDE